MRRPLPPYGETAGDAQESGADALCYLPAFSLFVSYAPLAQLVEHLTLNQGVQGSSP